MTVQEAAANALVDLELAADRIRGEAERLRELSGAEAPRRRRKAVAS